jgi:hypothetical protein
VPPLSRGQLATTAAYATVALLGSGAFVFFRLQLEPLLIWHLLGLPLLTGLAGCRTRRYELALGVAAIGLLPLGWHGVPGGSRWLVVDLRYFLLPPFGAWDSFVAVVSVRISRKLAVTPVAPRTHGPP